MQRNQALPSFRGGAPTAWMMLRARFWVASSMGCRLGHRTCDFSTDPRV